MRFFNINGKSEDNSIPIRLEICIELQVIKRSIVGATTPLPLHPPELNFLITTEVGVDSDYSPSANN